MEFIVFSKILDLINGSDRNAWSNRFGGCERLRNQYRMIGDALCEYEQQAPSFRSPSKETLRSFQQALVFVPVEVLESYCEDLLNLEIRQERLFIGPKTVSSNGWIVSIIGSLGALAIGLYAASRGSSLFVSFGLTVLLALPFAVLWHLATRNGSLRRFQFAQIVSQEIERRKGGKGGMSVAQGSGLIGGFFPGKVDSSRGNAVSSVSRSA